MSMVTPAVAPSRGKAAGSFDSRVGRRATPEALRTACFALALILCAGVVRPAWGAWPSGGLRVSGLAGNEGLGGLAADGTGGVFIAWGLGTGVYLQHIDGSGEVWPGWASSGHEMSGLVPSSWAFPVDLFPDGNGGVYVLIQHEVDCGIDCSPSGFFTFHRRDASGAIPRGWTSQGIQWPLVNAAAVDGTGGLLLAWHGYRQGQHDIWAQRLTSDGSVPPGWPSEGILVCGNLAEQFQVDVASDGLGGAFVSWLDSRSPSFYNRDVYAQRILASGEIAWNPDGIAICANLADQYRPVITSDGTGNAFLTWDDWRYQPQSSGSPTLMQKLLSNGSVAPGWPDGGSWVIEGNYGFCCPSLVPDRVGGAIVFGTVGHPGGVDILAQRRTASGIVAAGWPSGGVTVSQNDKSRPVAVGDDEGGAYVTAQVFGRSWVHHITRDGLPASGMPPGGQTLGLSGNWVYPKIVSDTRAGAMVAWSGDPDGDQETDLYLQRVAPDRPVGILASVVDAESSVDRVRVVWAVTSPPWTGVVVQRATDSQSWESMAAAEVDGSGRVSYEDQDLVPGTRRGYRLSFGDRFPGLTAGEVWLDIPAVAGLALEGFRPNPAVESASFSFSLPDARSASLEVYDVRGKVVFAREVAELGPGRHLLRWLGSETSRPGIYWIRLVHPAGTLMAKGIVVR